MTFGTSCPSMRLSCFQQIHLNRFRLLMQNLFLFACWKPMWSCLNILNDETHSTSDVNWPRVGQAVLIFIFTDIDRYLKITVSGLYYTDLTVLESRNSISTYQSLNTMPLCSRDVFISTGAGIHFSHLSPGLEDIPRGLWK